MPKRARIVLIGAACVVAAGAAIRWSRPGWGVDDPVWVARQFLTAWRSGQRQEAARWVHPDCLAQFGLSFQADDVEIRSFRLGKPTVRHDRAWVPYVELKARLAGEEVVLPAWVHLARHEGEWRVTEPGGPGPPNGVGRSAPPPIPRAA